MSAERPDLSGRAPSPSPALAQEDTVKLRVFLVDDSREFAESLAELLTATGRCEVVGTASSEELALRWSFQNEAAFDVAIVDLVLQLGSGFPVLAHLLKYQPGHVVVLSEYVSPSISETCKRLGVAGAFPKTQARECVDYVLGLGPVGPRRVGRT